MLHFEKYILTHKFTSTLIMKKTRNSKLFITIISENDASIIWMGYDAKNYGFLNEFFLLQYVPPAAMQGTNEQINAIYSMLILHSLAKYLSKHFL